MMREVCDEEVESDIAYLSLALGPCTCCASSSQATRSYTVLTSIESLVASAFLGTMSTVVRGVSFLNLRPSALTNAPSIPTCQIIHTDVECDSYCPISSVRGKMESVSETTLPTEDHSTSQHICQESWKVAPYVKLSGVCFLHYRLPDGQWPRLELTSTHAKVFEFQSAVFFAKDGYTLAAKDATFLNPWKHCKTRVQQRPRTVET
jgi:hypothetical protein